MWGLSTRTALLCAVGAGLLLLTVGLAYVYSEELILLGAISVVFLKEAVFGAAFRFLKGFFIRLGLTRIGPFLLLPLLPFFWRRHGKRKLVETARLFRALKRLALRRWQMLPRPVRFLLAGCVCITMLCVAFIAGGLLGFIAILPIRSAVTISAASWLWSKLVAFLARLALGKWLDRYFPVVWNGLPQKAREEMRRKYRRLWWMTMRRIIRDRKAFGRRAREATRLRLVDNFVPHPRDVMIQ